MPTFRTSKEQQQWRLAILELTSDISPVGSDGTGSSSKDLNRKLAALAKLSSAAPDAKTRAEIDKRSKLFTSKLDEVIKGNEAETTLLRKGLAENQEELKKQLQALSKDVQAQKKVIEENIKDFSHDMAEKFKDSTTTWGGIFGARDAKKARLDAKQRKQEILADRKYLQKMLAAQYLEIRERLNSNPDNEGLRKAKDDIVHNIQALGDSKSMDVYRFDEVLRNLENNSYDLDSNISSTLERISDEVGKIREADKRTQELISKIGEGVAKYTLKALDKVGYKALNLGNAVRLGVLLGKSPLSLMRSLRSTGAGLANTLGAVADRVKSGYASNRAFVKGSRLAYSDVGEEQNASVLTSNLLSRVGKSSIDRNNIAEYEDRDKEKTRAISTLAKASEEIARKAGKDKTEGFLSNLWGWVKGLGATVARLLPTLSKMVPGAIAGLASALGGWVMGMGTRIVGALKDSARFVWESAAKVFNSAKTWVFEAADNAFLKVKEFLKPVLKFIGMGEKALTSTGAKVAGAAVGTKAAGSIAGSIAEKSAGSGATRLAGKVVGAALGNVGMGVGLALHSENAGDPDEMKKLRGLMSEDQRNISDAYDARKQARTQSLFNNAADRMYSISKGTVGNGPSMDYSLSGSLEKMVKKQPGVDLEGLNPALRSAFTSAVDEYYQRGGKGKVQINSGFRSVEKQSVLFAQDPGKAAPPGRSNHNYGLALDANSPELNEMDKMGLLSKYGLVRPVPGEPWHVELASTRNLVAKGVTQQEGGEKRGVNNTGGTKSSLKPVAQQANVPKALPVPATVTSAPSSVVKQAPQSMGPSIKMSTDNVPMHSYNDTSFFALNLGSLSQ